jgi:TP901 family phage tail tape measure protein
MPFTVGQLIATLRLDSAQFDAQIRRAQGELTTAAGSAERMAGATDTAAGALAGAGRQAGMASAQTAKLRAAQLSATAAQERYNAVLATTNASRARLASTEASMIRANQRVAATEREIAAATATANAETGAAAGLATRAGSAFGGMARMAAGLGVAFGAFELIKKAIDITKQANEFQRSMVQVQTNADVTAAEVNKASAALLKMAGPVAAAPADLATAWYHAKSVGLDYAKSIETTKIAAEGARVGHADLEETMNALTSTVASGIPGVDNMSSAMGKLIAIVGSGDMHLSDLNEALGSGILSVVKGYGLSLTDVGAALATFGDNNIRGAQAATMLRMSVQAMAVPAKAGAAQLDKLGLSSTQLRDDMQKGGLNLAIHDLKAHLDAAGVSTKHVGGILTEVFGKRAGPGLAVLLGQTDRLDSKFKVLEASGASFGDKWKATTQTASFALARFGHMVEAAGIQLTARLGPSIAQAANWLGTSLPHAISVLADILGPTVHMIGVGFVAAFAAALAVLRPILTVLGSLGHYLADNASTVRDVTGLVAGLWLAWKGYTAAVAAITAVRTALAAYRGEMVATTAAGARFGTSMASFTEAGGPAALALLAFGAGVGLAGKQLSNFIEHGRSGVAVINNLGSAYRSWLDALNATNGALNESVLKSVAAQLQNVGLAGKAEAAGISLNDLTHAVTGNADGFDRLIDRWKASGSPSDDTIQALKIMRAMFGGASANAADLATVTDKLSTAESKSATAADAQAAARRQQLGVLRWIVDVNGNLVETTAKVAGARTRPLRRCRLRLAHRQALKTAEDLLNGVNESVETSTDALSIALGNLANGQSLATDKNGHAIRSLNQSTVAGATNRQMLVGLIDAAKAQAQATADQAAKNHTLGQALRIGNTQLGKNEDAIRKAARLPG